MAKNLPEVRTIGLIQARVRVRNQENDAVKVKFKVGKVHTNLFNFLN